MKLKEFYVCAHKIVFCFWIVYNGVVFKAITTATATRDSHYLLALATLDNATEIGSFLLAKVSI